MSSSTLLNLPLNINMCDPSNLYQHFLCIFHPESKNVVIQTLANCPLPGFWTFLCSLMTNTLTMSHVAGPTGNFFCKAGLGDVIF